MPKRKNSRAAAGSGTIRQRKDGKWEARYTVGRDPGTGKQLQRSIYGDTQKDVLQKLQKVQTTITSGTYTEPARMTVGQWLDVWLAEYTGNVKDSTSRSYSDHVTNHIKPALGATLLTKLNTHSIQGFYNKLGSEKGLSPKTVANIHGVLHRALGQAVALRYLPFNPSDACTLPRHEKPEMNVLTEEQMTAFLLLIKGQRLGGLFFVAMFTGLRHGELLGLTWDCVDFDGQTILVNKQLQKERVKGGVYRFVSLKNDKARRISPASSVFDVLRDCQSRQIEARFKAGSLWKDTGLVFTNETGEHLAPGTVRHWFKHYVSHLGIPETRLHDLRHTYATASLANGDDVKTVQANLGHHTAAFTLDNYGHATEKMRQDSAARMERFIKGISNL